MTFENLPEPFSDIKEKEGIVLENGVLLPTIKMKDGITLMNGAIHVTKIPRRPIKILIQNERKGEIKTFRRESSLKRLDEEDEKKDKIISSNQIVTISQDTTSPILRRVLATILIGSFLALCYFIFSSTSIITSTNSSSIKIVEYGVPETNDSLVSLLNSKIIEEEAVSYKGPKAAFLNELIVSDAITLKHHQQQVIEETKEELNKTEKNVYEEIDTTEAEKKGEENTPLDTKEDTKEENSIDSATIPNPRSARVENHRRYITVTQETSNTTATHFGFPGVGNSEIILGFGFVSIGAGAAILASTLWF